MVVQTKEIISFSKGAPSIPFITHFPTQVFTFERRVFQLWRLQEAKEKSLKKKFQPGCSIRGSYQFGILLFGIKPPSRIGKEKRGKKRAMPSPSIMSILWTICPENPHSSQPRETQLFVNTRMCYIFVTFTSNHQEQKCLCEKYRVLGEN